MLFSEKSHKKPLNLAIKKWSAIFYAYVIIVHDGQVFTHTNIFTNALVSTTDNTLTTYHKLPILSWVVSACLLRLADYDTKKNLKKNLTFIRKCGILKYEKKIQLTPEKSEFWHRHRTCKRAEDAIWQLQDKYLCDKRLESCYYMSMEHGCRRSSVSDHSLKTKCEQITYINESIQE